MTNEEMSIAIQGGDKSHILELWQRVKYLCFAIAGRYYRRYQARFVSCGVELEDYRQECYFAFLKAVSAYKPEKDTKFTSYLPFHIRNTGAALLGLQRSDDTLNKCVSLHETINTDDNAPISQLDLIEDESALERLEKVLNDIQCIDTREKLTRAIQRLDERKQAVITGYYFHDLPLKAIGQALGISAKGANWQRTKALKLLRCMPDVVILRKEQKIDKTLNKEQKPCSAAYIGKQRLASRIIKRGAYFSEEKLDEIYENCMIERKAIENPEYMLWDTLADS